MPYCNAPEIVEKMRTALAEIQPVESADWLTRHRPSVALLCCLGSGPWKLPRRQLIQERAIAALGPDDLSSQAAVIRVFEVFPLEWQQSILHAVHVAVSHEPGGFDGLVKSCQDSKLPPSVFVGFFGAALDCSFDRLPKVVLMFLRDYFEAPVLPRDRHVNDWLRRHGLPQKNSVVDAMREVVGVAKVAAYARGVFCGVSKNPELEATR